MRNRLSAVLLLVTCVSVPILAQYRYLPDSPGSWKPWTFTAYADNRRVHGAGPAEVKDLEAQLLRLNDVIKKTPGIAKPIGFSVETSGVFGLADGRLSARSGEPALIGRPLPATLNFLAFPVMEFGQGATAKRSDTGETAGLYFFVNQLLEPLTSILDASVPEFAQLDADVVRLADAQPDVLGFPRYGNSLVIKKSAAPIWVAVTFAETLDLAARGIEHRLTGERDVVARLEKAHDDAKDPKKREARVAQYRKLAPQVKDPAYLDKMMKVEADMEKQADAAWLPQIASARAVVTKSEQELASVRASAAGLSASDRTAPACYAAREPVSVSRFRRGSAPRCTPLVRANWKLFNPALPRSAPQVLSIGHFDRCLGPDQRVPSQPGLHVGGCTANLKLLEAIDKTALLAWLK